MNTHEEYVTYAQAKALKELGFDWPCWYWYSVSEDGTQTLMGDPLHMEYRNKYPNEPDCAVPTQAVACRWLREEKGLFIDVWLCAAGWSWNIEKCGRTECNGTYVTKHDEESGDDEDSGLFTTYEKTLSAGINRAFELLKGGSL